ncbi:sensor histidine kinase [Sphingomonas sp. ID0503]|uniref:sensor histidine kinase n=1 Tax=Sphingomonas sp. ID0503 TaxID=3399691 RepID=UPI003AFAE97B
MTGAAATSILYIDDDDGLRRLTRRALGRAGYAVTLAGSGAEGIALARETAFDLVAVDHYMPGLDGLQTLAELKTLPAPPPVIYVTGSEEGRLAIAALKAGAIDYVVKSATEDYFDLLIRAIEQALESVHLRAAKEAVEAQLRESNERLQTLLSEVNHRVANSLQLVSAFIHMQAREVTDAGAKAVLADTQRRVAAISQVHKRLYTSDSVEAVDMSDYLQALVQELGDTWSTPAAPREIRLSANPLKLATDKAVAVGIIVTELVTNACKYAYAADAPGEVRVALSESDGAFRVVVEDDGCGLGQSPVSTGTGLGSKLIGAMAATLRATIDYEPSDPGLRAVLSAQI